MYSGQPFAISLCLKWELITRVFELHSSKCFPCYLTRAILLYLYIFSDNQFYRPICGRLDEDWSLLNQISSELTNGNIAIEYIFIFYAFLFHVVLAQRLSFIKKALLHQQFYCLNRNNALLVLRPEEHHRSNRHTIELEVGWLCLYCACDTLLAQVYKHV